LAKTSDSAEDAIAAVEYMQALLDQGVGNAWVVPAHIERANSYTIADFRNWNNAGPDVAFGYEGAPGHQTSGSRGFSTSADGGGTYGGSGWTIPPWPRSVFLSPSTCLNWITST
jgi:hypothetical protein